MDSDLLFIGLPSLELRHLRLDLILL